MPHFHPESAVIISAIVGKLTILFLSRLEKLIFPLFLRHIFSSTKAEDSRYTVVRLNVPFAHDLITIVGNFPEIHPGQTLRLTGVNLRKAPNDCDQFALARHVEAEHGVPAFFAVKRDALDDSLYVFDIELICARKSFFS